MWVRTTKLMRKSDAPRSGAPSSDTAGELSYHQSTLPRVHQPSSIATGLHIVLGEGELSSHKALRIVCPQRSLSNHQSTLPRVHQPPNIATGLHMKCEASNRKN